MKRINEITTDRYDLVTDRKNIELVLVNGDIYHINVNGFLIDRLCTCRAGYTGVNVVNFKEHWSLYLPANSIKEIWEVDTVITNHVHVRNQYDFEDDKCEIKFEYIKPRFKVDDIVFNEHDTYSRETLDSANHFEKDQRSDFLKFVNKKLK